MAKILRRCFSRLVQALLVFGACGLVGVLADVDHIVCLWLDLGAWNPAAFEYGCRLWHPAYIVIGWVGIGVALSCGAGWVLGLVLHAAWTAAHDRHGRS